MFIPITDGKKLAYTAYHSVVVSVLAMGYPRLRKMILKGATPNWTLSVTMLQW